VASSAGRAGNGREGKQEDDGKSKSNKLCPLSGISFSHFVFRIRRIVLLGYRRFAPLRVGQAIQLFHPQQLLIILLIFPILCNVVE